MNDNMLDVLMYLFTREPDEPSETLSAPEKTSLIKELRLLGFPSHEVEQAFSWLKTLDHIAHRTSVTAGLVPASRVFHPEEAMRLDKAGRSFLFALEQANLIDPNIRENILENAMMLETSIVSVEQLKYITLMLLCHYEPEAKSRMWLDTLIEQPAIGSLH